MKKWVDVIGYEGLYKVNEDGQVLALESIRVCKNGAIKTYPEKILKGFVNNVGYLCYDLNKCGFRKNIKAHRLVGIHFLEGFNENLVINHKDGNKLNNHKLNIEWITFKENVKHAFKTRLIVKKGLDVLDVQTGIFYESIGDAFRTGLIKTSYSQFKKKVREVIKNDTQFLRV